VLSLKNALFDFLIKMIPTDRGGVRVTNFIKNFKIKLRLSPAERTFIVATFLASQRMRTKFFCGAP
jgi:hypothetical protein